MPQVGSAAALSAACRVIVPNIETHEVFARTAALDAPSSARHLRWPVHATCSAVGSPVEHISNPLAKAASPQNASCNHWTGSPDKPRTSLSAMRQKRRCAKIGSSKWLASIVELSDDAIIGLEPRWHIASWNKGEERLFGYNRAFDVNRQEGSSDSPRMLTPRSAIDRISQLDLGGRGASLTIASLSRRRSFRLNSSAR